MANWRQAAATQHPVEQLAVKQGKSFGLTPPRRVSDGGGRSVPWSAGMSSQIQVKGKSMSIHLLIGQAVHIVMLIDGHERGQRAHLLILASVGMRQQAAKQPAVVQPRALVSRVSIKRLGH